MARMDGMDALLTLLFFVILWGAAKAIGFLGRGDPQLRALHQALHRGRAGSQPHDPKPEAPPAPTPGEAPSASGGHGLDGQTAGGRTAGGQTPNDRTT